MTGLQTCSSNIGRNLPRLIYSDAAPNIHVLRSALPDDESEQMAHKEFQGLGIRLQKEGARIKRMVPYSQWTNGKMEKLFHLMKSILKTWNVLNKGLPLLDFNFYISQAETVMNQRPLLLQDLQQEMMVITPNDLIYGGNQLQKMTQSSSSHPLLSLYDNLIANTQVLRRLWVEAYMGHMRKWAKWKFNDVAEVGDLLLIPDRAGSSLGYGILTQMITDRTLQLEVISKLPQTDKDGNIIKGAVKSLITRSAHSCVLLGKREFLSSGVETEEDLAAGADVAPVIPDTGPEEEIDEEGSEEENPDTQPPLLRPSTSPEPTVPETGPEEDHVDDLLEALAPMPKTATTPVGEF